MFPYKPQKAHAERIARYRSDAEARGLLIAAGAIRPEEPTTGVFEQNDLEYIYEELNNAIDLDYEEHIRTCQDRECLDNEHDTWESYMPTYLIGFVWNDEDQVYDLDPKAEYSAIWNSRGTIQVVKSDWLIRGGLCSPAILDKLMLTQRLLIFWHTACRQT